MDVTCERCHTEYEFDDALVSEQGTSVRCTQCGHKFRVKKQGGVATPEIWVVRTIDGRELEFRAIRDLKTAISGGRISRDDVLSRGVGRPRRLASIAELEPFFSGHAHLKTHTQIGLGEEPRARSVTPQGLGPPMITEDSSPGRENSVAIPLPSAAAAEVTRQYPRELAQDVSRLDDEAKNAGATTAVFGTPASTKAQAEHRMTPALGTPNNARSPSRPAAIELAPATEREPQSIEPDTTRRNDAAAATPKPRAVGFGGTQPLQALPPPQRTPSKPSISEKPPPVAPLPSPEPPPAPATRADSSNGKEVASGREAPSQREAQLPPLSEVEPSTLRREASAEAQAAAQSKPDPSRSPSERAPSERPPVVDRPASERPLPPAIAVDAAQDGRLSRESMDSIPPEPGMRRGSQTPTPSEVRYSISNEDSNVSSDPRLSGGSSRSASGATRLIVGLLVAGVVVFVLVLLVQRFIMKAPAKTETASDQRVTTFLTEGEKSLAEGDLDGAKEVLDKASALGDSDPRIAKALARVANARADIPWLRLRLLTMDDPEREPTKRDYADAADRARKAVEKAQSLASSDAEVVRAEVDQKRLAGDVSGARKLVDGMASVSSQPESSLVLGALDLAEESPPWPSVIDRLSKAAAQEGGLGRARALLVYSLAMSGDPKAARTELGRLGALARPHPLTGALRKFLDRVDKGETPPLKVSDLPSLSSPSSVTDAGMGGNDIPGSTAAALKQALDARSHGDTHRAENLYQSVIDKDPNNSEALAGLASLARGQGGTGRAMGLYQRVIDHNPNYVPAIMALADMKWDGGDRAAASALYARAVELGSSEARAHERSTGGATTSPPETSTSSSSGGATPPPDTGGATGGAPTPSAPPPTPDPPKEGTP